MSKILRFYFFMFILVASTSYGQDIWVKEGRNSRYYLSIESTDTSLKLNHFFQEKGEYQSLVSTFKFSDKENLISYINQNFAGYVQKEILPAWKISNKVEKNQPKGLFGSRNQVLWVAKNQWDIDWENKYAQWLQNEVTPDFFKKYNIQTDCADALVGLRWIFARMNSLPVANTLADTRSLFGHFSIKKEWRKYSTAPEWHKDQLFLAALDYIMNLTSTRTVVFDAFPVKLDREGLKAGTFIVTQNDGSGHVKIISENYFDELTELPIMTLASTSPRALRVMAREIFLDQDWPEKNSKEILAFRWPIVVADKWILQEEAARSTYSLEQFDTKLKQESPAFFQYVFSKVKDNYDPLKLIELGSKDIANYALQRVQIVKDGYAYCLKNNCAPGTLGDDDWGTPSRDAKLLKKFYDLDKMIMEYELLSPGLFDRWMSALRSETIEVEGEILSLASLRFILENKLHSSLASDTPQKRWGLHSSMLLDAWMLKIEKMLNERNETLRRTDISCDEACFPKNNIWLSLSTHQIDSELNKIYTEVMTYCSIVSKSSCQKYFETQIKKKLTYDNQEKSLKEWFDIIPYFNSDPKAGLKERWGEIPKGIVAQVLPYFDNIKISKNALGLIDFKKLINLKTNQLLHESSNSKRLIMTLQGEVFEIDDTNGIIERLIVTGNSVRLLTVLDPENLLKMQVERLVYVKENQGTLLFIKPLLDSQIIFRIKNNRIEAIKEFRGSIDQFDSLVATVADSNILNFIDLNLEISVDIPMPRNSTFVDINSLKISSYKFPNVILEYSDKDNDLYYSILVDLEKKSWIRIAPELMGKSKLVWSDASLKKALIQSNFNQEYPTLHAVGWNSLSEFTVTSLGNLFFGAHASKGIVYFIDGVGGLWDQKPAKTLYQWGAKLEKSAAPFNDMKVQFLNSEGVYFSSANEGLFQLFGHQKSFRLPKDLLGSDDFCQIQKHSSEILSYRFSTSYGDYSCMGGSLLVSSLNGPKEWAVSQFSHYSWINKENLLDQRWQQIFSEFVVGKGALISIGKNSGLWWGTE